MIKFELIYESYNSAVIARMLIVGRYESSSAKFTLNHVLIIKNKKRPSDKGIMWPDSSAIKIYKHCLMNEYIMSETASDLSNSGVIDIEREVAFYERACVVNELCINTQN